MTWFFQSKFNMKYRGFTLVELIVVITILAILGTIGFISIQGYSSSARDSARISNLVNLHKGLTLFQTVGGSYPMPESPITLLASGSIIGYQGFARDQVAGIAKLSAWATKDPLDPTIYTTYSTNVLQTKMQLMAFLEDGSKVTAYMPGITELSAATNTNYAARSPMTKWDTLGILLGTGTTLNQPVQELLSESFTGIDVVSTSTGYTAVFSKTDTVSGTGKTLQMMESVMTLGKFAANCKNYLDNSKQGLYGKDWFYFINPTGAWAFKVFCDMTTDWGGWTLIIADSVEQLTVGQINSLFQSSTWIFRYKVGPTTVAFYQRLNWFSSFPVYTYIATHWASVDNLLGINFKLYSTFVDLTDNKNTWTYCNYDDPGVWFPRDCGPTTSIGGRWYGPTYTGGSTSWQIGTFHIR